MDQKEELLRRRSVSRLADRLAVLAVEKQRQEQNKEEETWADVAAEAGCTEAQYTEMNEGAAVADIAVFLTKLDLDCPWAVDVLLEKFPEPERLPDEVEF